MSKREGDDVGGEAALGNAERYVRLKNYLMFKCDHYYSFMYKTFQEVGRGVVPALSHNFSFKT